MAMRNRSRPTTGAIGGMRKGCSCGTAVLVWSGDRQRRGAHSIGFRMVVCLLFMLILN